jgi:PAS domain S-box-containing protein
MAEGAYTVLNVSGDSKVLRARSGVLAQSGCRVFEAATGKEALRMGAAQGSDLILINGTLPDMSGTEACRLLKENRTTARTMVLLVSTGDTTGGPKEQSPDAAADGYLNEPVEPGELVASVHALLRLHAREAENRRLVEQLARERAERKQVEQHLHELEERYRLIADMAQQGMWLIDRRGYTLFANRRMAEMLGCTLQEIRAKTFYDFCFFEDSVQARERIAGHGVERPDPVEFRFRRMDGTSLLVQGEIRSLQAGANRPAATLMVFADMSAGKQAEERLRESRERLQYALDSADMVAWDWTPESDALIQSTNASRVLGLPQGATLATGKEYFALIHQQDQPRVVAAIQRAVRERSDYHEEFRLIAADASVRWVADRGRVTESETGGGIRMTGVIRDITGLKMRETAVRESAERFRAIFHQAAVGMCLLNPEGELLQVNEKLCALLGEEAEGLLHRTLPDLTHPDDRARNQQSMSRLLLGGVADVSIEQRLVQRSGNSLWVSMYLALLWDAGGRLEHVIGMVQDIDERKQAEKQLHRLNADLEHRVAARTRELVHSQNRLRKLASDLSVAEERERRRVAGELHDYLAQLLVATRMKLNQGLHSRSATRQSELLREVDDMLDQSLTYTRTLVAQLSPPVLHEFGLAAAMKWLGEQMPRHGLSVDSTIEARPLNLTENQAVLLFQSARELLLNVVKHAGTGRASVQLKSHGGELRLTVRDEGRGFEMSLLKETAASSNAFGLFSIRERMESLGGRCEIVTRPGHGTIVTLAMPLSGDDRSAEFKVLSAELVEAESPTALSTQASTLSTRHSALRQHARFRVLLVDDHAMVRQGLRSLLENHGDVEVVAEAGDGLQAIALAETLCPDVIVMDLSLPLLDGVEATRRICLAHPAMIVIGLSVHQNRQMEQAVKGAGAAAFLTKDCAVDQLYEAISSAVPARSS